MQNVQVRESNFRYSAIDNKREAVNDKWAVESMSVSSANELWLVTIETFDWLF